MRYTGERKARYPVRAKRERTFCPGKFETASVSKVRIGLTRPSTFDNTWPTNPHSMRGIGVTGLFTKRVFCQGKIETASVSKVRIGSEGDAKSTAFLRGI